MAVLTGAGDKFFCIGGEHDELSSMDYSSVMPVIDLYEFIDTMPKPVIAAVNGFAVGGGNVLQVVCDLSVAAPHAVFRQVGPLVGSFDAGYGTWYLEETIGRRRAKEMWYLNRKYSAEQALEMGLVNEIAADPVARAVEISQTLRATGSVCSGCHSRQRSRAVIPGLPGRRASRTTCCSPRIGAVRRPRRCRRRSSSDASPIAASSISECDQQ